MEGKVNKTTSRSLYALRIKENLRLLCYLCNSRQSSRALLKHDAFGEMRITVALYFLGLGAELYYVREGTINTYAMNFVVPIAYNIDDIEFTWQSLVGEPVSLNISISLHRL